MKKKVLNLPLLYPWLKPAEQKMLTAACDSYSLGSQVFYMVDPFHPRNPMVRSEVIDCARPIGDFLLEMNVSMKKGDKISITLFMTRLKYFFLLPRVRVARVLGKAGFEVLECSGSGEKRRITAGRLGVYEILGKLFRYPSGSSKSRSEISHLTIGVLADRLIQLGTPRKVHMGEQWRNTVVNLYFFGERVIPRRRPDHILTLLSMPKSPFLHYLGSPETAHLGNVRRHMKPLEADTTISLIMTELAATGRVHSELLGGVDGFARVPQEVLDGLVGKPQLDRVPVLV